MSKSTSMLPTLAGGSGVSAHTLVDADLMKVVDAATLIRAREKGVDPAALLADNDSTGFFEALGDLLRPGPTLTNVNDLRAILIDP